MAEGCCSPDAVAHHNIDDAARCRGAVLLEAQEQKQRLGTALCGNSLHKAPGAQRQHWLVTAPEKDSHAVRGVSLESSLLPCLQHRPKGVQLGCHDLELVIVHGDKKIGGKPPPPAPGTALWPQGGQVAACRPWQEVQCRCHRAAVICLLLCRPLDVTQQGPPLPLTQRGCEELQPAQAPPAGAGAPQLPDGIALGREGRPSGV
eukprot:CAMPEP_0117652138 /NCGR_PEP_ID=MMETSP0804-20121206/2467_1 /TAXON_ID=1074897 /ORGANISM="Tetraselmis astigmatica, Strain CCMP880" /LENGTH=203 /DNA_ID=CAMNT_0005458165 /DNA_START=214 /DNA_END=824 /DNA_ORIENTATION=+